MPWIWVAVVLVLWTAAALAVIVLCVAARQIDARLGRDRIGVLFANQAEPRPGPRAKLE